MYIDDNYSLSDNVYQGDQNLGFSLNPIKNIQQVAQQVQAVVAKVAPPIVAKLSPTNVIARQANAVAKIDTKAKALTLRAAQSKAKTIYAATAASPMGKKLVTPMLDVGAVKSPIGRQLMPEITANIATQQAINAQNQATYNAQVAAQSQAQAAADAQYATEQAQYVKDQAAYDAQYAQDQAAQQAAWEANQSQFTSSGGGGGWSDTSQSDPFASPSIYDAATIDTGAMVLNPTADMSTAPVDNTPVPAWDPYSLSTDNQGDNMQLSNIPSRRSLVTGTFSNSGLGDIWGDLMTTATTMYGQKTAAQIQQSQAAQADATARIAAANAAAVAAQQRPAISTPVMLAGAAALAGALYFMRKKRRA